MSSQFQDEGGARAQQIAEEILNYIRTHESTHITERTYSDQPIIRTGADLLREREAREEREREAREAREKREREARQERERFRQQARQSRGAFEGSLRRIAGRQEPVASSPSERSWFLEEDRLQEDPFRRVAPAEDEELPPTLKRLRELQRPEAGKSRPSVAAVFESQARLAENYEDDFPLPQFVPSHYMPDYAQLSNEELRGYFSWRTKWRRGDRSQAPSTFVSVLMAELVIGVGCSPGQDGLDKLVELRDVYSTRSVPTWWEDFRPNFRATIVDYAVVHGLDPSVGFDEETLRFDKGMATLRRAERAALRAMADDGDQTAQEVVAGVEASDETVSDQEILEALGAVSTYDINKSPFVRTHKETSAAVVAEVFRRLVVHCERRRKVGYLDGIFGNKLTRTWYPYWNLPVRKDVYPEEQGRIAITPARSITHIANRWVDVQLYGYADKSREVSRMLRAVDRQMRIEWDYGHPLKQQKIPKFLDTMIEKACAETHGREVARELEAKRRRFEVDFSKLGDIRAAAATTREALLVDEEREGYVPSAAPATIGETRPDDAATPATAAPAADAAAAVPESAESMVAMPTAAVPAATPAEHAPSADAPCGLTPDELALVRALLDGVPVPKPVPGSPSIDMLVDSANEKLLDLLGDTPLEFDGDAPRVVEDYEDDLRGLLDQ